jgi:putative OPT family oligopeptide transporter
MLLIGVKGAAGVAAVLGVATVVCCAACMAGDMIQDLKVGHLIGGTPWKMEVAEIIATVIASFFIVLPIMMLHQGNLDTGGIGGTALPAPQAGLMAMMSKGIIGGEMPWMLIIVGMFFSIFLITINAPSPMLIAVGMYLPIETTSAIMIGGLMKYFFDKAAAKKRLSQEEKSSAENKGILIASGFVAGEAILGVLLSRLVLMNIESLASFFFGISDFAIYEYAGGWLSLIVFGIIGYALMKVPMKTK